MRVPQEPGPGGSSRCWPKLMVSAGWAGHDFSGGGSPKLSRGIPKRGCPILPRFLREGGPCVRTAISTNARETSPLSRPALPALHHVSCYQRLPLLDKCAAKQTFERELERVRVWYGPLRHGLR